MYFTIPNPQAIARKGGRLSKIKAMIMETYRATVKHDTGVIRKKSLAYNSVGQKDRSSPRSEPSFCGQRNNPFVNATLQNANTSAFTK